MWNLGKMVCVISPPRGKARPDCDSDEQRYEGVRDFENICEKLSLV